MLASVAEEYMGSLQGASEVVVSFGEAVLCVGQSKCVLHHHHHHYSQRYNHPKTTRLKTLSWPVHFI